MGSQVVEGRVYGGERYAQARRLRVSKARTEAGARRPGSQCAADLPRPAPEGSRPPFPALSRFRFFDLFFPESAEPVLVSAYGRGGALIKRERGPAAAQRPASS
jgi:hypothetical protein